MHFRGGNLADVLEPSIKATLISIPGGKAGVVATLKRMKEQAKAAVRDPDQAVRQTAEKLVAHLPARNYFGEIRMCHEYVRDGIRYVRDPVSVERVASPAETMKSGQGDCDDKATLLGALLDSIGHPVQFVAIGLNGQPLSHVLLETRVRNGWMPLETIIPVEAGWWPDDVTSAYRMSL